MLQREDALMQEILDRGLRHEDRRTLRRLVSGNSEEVEVAQQVVAAIGAEMEALQAVLVRNRRELLELSATTVPERKRDLVSGLDAVRSELQGAQDAARGELLAAKERGENAVVRSVGRSFNDLKALLQRVEGDRRKLTRNSALAALLVTVCRRVLPVRIIDPSELKDIPPSHEGYLRIADFHLFSDSGLYDFGEHCSGPNLFTRLRRNVAILLVKDVRGQVVYNSFAVSGELKTAGAPPVPPDGPLYSIEAEDEHGRKFDRRHDAEFKLLSGFCDALDVVAQNTGKSEGSDEASLPTESASSSSSRPKDPDSPPDSSTSPSEPGRPMPSPDDPSQSSRPSTSEPSERARPTGLSLESSLSGRPSESLSSELPRPTGSTEKASQESRPNQSVASEHVRPTSSSDRLSGTSPELPRPMEMEDVNGRPSTVENEDPSKSGRPNDSVTEGRPVAGAERPTDAEATVLRPTASSLPRPTCVGTDPPRPTESSAPRLTDNNPAELVRPNECKASCAPASACGQASGVSGSPCSCSQTELEALAKSPRGPPGCSEAAILLSSFCAASEENSMLPPCAIADVAERGTSSSEATEPPAKRQKSLEGLNGKAVAASSSTSVPMNGRPIPPPDPDTGRQRPISPHQAFFKEWKGSGRLWSRKPLCRSCAGAVRQLRLRFPQLELEVLVGETDETMVIE